MRGVSDRTINVFFWFALWLGAAALACGLFAPTKLSPAESASSPQDQNVVRVKTADATETGASAVHGAAVPSAYKDEGK